MPVLLLGLPDPVTEVLIAIASVVIPGLVLGLAVAGLVHQYFGEGA